MSQPLITYDNRSKAFSELTDKPQALEDLSCIADTPIKDLKDSDSGHGLLIFPDSFGDAGDKIGTEKVFSIEGEEQNAKLVTGNIMGFVGKGETILKIRSRFDDGRGDYFMHYMLERVLSINLFDLSHSSSQEEIFDFRPFLFPYYLKKAMAQGLYREYRTFERNDANLRGLLDVSRHIRLNYPATGKIAFRSREHTADNALTQLIRHTIEVIKANPIGPKILSCDEDTKAFVSQITLATGTYNKADRQKVIQKNLRLRVHPYYYEYTPLAKLCLQILRNEQIKYGADDDRIYGVLFDGAWLWEEYLNTFISKPCDLVHSRNKTGENPIYQFDGKKGVCYSDFMSKSLISKNMGDDDGIIIDAKYKGYSDTDVSKIQREDRFQVISYMYITKAKTGAFIFPHKGDNLYSNSATLNGYGGSMHLLGLPISSAESYVKFIEEMQQNEDELVGGINSMKRQ